MRNDVLTEDPHKFGRDTLFREKLLKVIDGTGECWSWFGTRHFGLPDMEEHLTVELTRRREFFFLLPFSFCLRIHAPAARVQRFVRRRSVSGQPQGN